MSEWSETTLGELCKFQAGDAFAKDQQGLTAGDYPFIKVSDMNLLGNERFIQQSNNWIRKADVSKYRLHQPGSIAFAKIGEALRANRRRVIVRETIIDNNMMSATPKGGMEPLFLLYLLEGIDFNDVSRGSALPYLTVGDLNQLPVRVPSPETQKVIGQSLSLLDRKIELNRRMNETLEGMAQAIFRDWFVDFGPVRRAQAGLTDPVAIMGGLTPDTARAAPLAALFPAAFGNNGLPVGWNEEPLLDQANWINGAAYKNMHFVPKGLGLPVVKIAELKAGITEQTKFTNTDLGQKYRINDGELLFSWSGNPDTSIDAFIWTGGEAWLNQHIFAVRENGKMDRPTLHTMLKWLMPQFAELARNKQTTGLGHVTKDDMKRLLIAKPPLPVATAFATFAGPIFERIVATLYENRTLAETRDYLLPRLMSGAVRVTPQAEAA
ncbi:restriction endonuclease subunit S [Sphingobium cupriresistens]|uniref:restriction endonuclease subunit S n=1 Tax=Sphingobium cupriresistens TaxID=1132417 RepID=UPI003BADF8EF